MTSTPSISLPTIDALVKAMDKRTAQFHAALQTQYPHCHYPYLLVSFACALGQIKGTIYPKDFLTRYAEVLVVLLRKADRTWERNPGPIRQVISDLLTGKKTRPFGQWPRHRDRTKGKSYFAGLILAQHLGEISALKNIDLLNDQIQHDLAEKFFTPVPPENLKTEEEFVYGQEPENAVYRPPRVRELVESEPEEVQKHFFGLKTLFPAVHDAVLLLLARHVQQPVTPRDYGAKKTGIRMTEIYPAFGARIASVISAEIGRILDHTAFSPEYPPTILYLANLLDLQFPRQNFSRQLFTALRAGPNTEWWKDAANCQRPTSKQRRGNTSFHHSTT